MRRRVFISYRHVEPDEGLALAIGATLRARDVPFFIDQKNIKIGDDWVAMIKMELLAADSFVVLLSDDAMLSDMVRQEIRLAHEQYNKGKMRIFPIRIDEPDLPYDVAAALSKFHYGTWQLSQSTDPVCDQVVAAILGKRDLPSIERDDPESRVLTKPRRGPRATGAPLPSADPRIRMETGTIRVDSPFYVRREADDTVEKIIGEPDMTLILKGPRQSGKSSLLARVHALARRRGIRSVYVDLERLDASQGASLDGVLRWLFRRIASELQLDVPGDLWRADWAGPAEGSTDFLKRYILDDHSQPVQICLDEVDRIFAQDTYRDDFFSLIRSWHNERAFTERFRKLGIAIAHATEPGLYIKDIHRSPFNVGYRFLLGEFSTDQVLELNRRYHGALQERDIESFHDFVGGQPYLVRQGLYSMRYHGWSFARLRSIAADNDGPFGDHLRARVWLLRREPRLGDVVRRVLSEGVCDDERDFLALHAAGIVRGVERRRARVACPLYAEYFSKHL